MDLTTKQTILIVLLVSPLLLIQGAWMFKDAKKRGDKYYWIWGIFGILNIPSNLLIYLIVTRIIQKEEK